MQSNKQFLWDQAQTACKDGSIVAGTSDLASMHNTEENDAAVAAMRYAGCQTAWFGACLYYHQIRWN